MSRAALLLAIFMALAACGGGDDTDPGQDTSPPADTVQADTSEDTSIGEDTTADTTPEEDICEPACEDFECGDDGCGGSCGDCPAGDQWACVDHMCECTADCGDAACGPDGCGDSCGDCPEGEDCGADGQCHLCDLAGKTFSDAVLKINHLEMGEGGYPGMALDVDEDPDTCAPVDACSDGLNNQLGGLLEALSQYLDANEELAGALAEGQIILLAELVDPALDGSAFLMNMYLGEAVEPVETCDWQNEKCDYLVKGDSFDVTTCAPVIAFDNATVNGTDFLAGGKDYLFSVSIPVMEGAILTITAYMARIEGTAVIEGDAISGLTDAIVGGAVPKALLLEAVDNIPDDIELPVTKDMIKALLEMLIIPDIDTDGDGDPESASIGIQFTAIQGAITGIAPEEEE